MSDVWIDTDDVARTAALLGGAAAELRRARFELGDALNDAGLDHSDPGVGQADIVGRTQLLLAILADMSASAEADGDEMIATLARAHQADRPFGFGPGTGSPATGDLESGDDSEGGGVRDGGGSWWDAVSNATLDTIGGAGDWVGSSGQIDAGRWLFDRTVDSTDWAFDTGAGLYRWQRDSAPDLVWGAAEWLYEQDRALRQETFDLAVDFGQVMFDLEREWIKTMIRQTVGEQTWNAVVETTTPFVARFAYSKAAELVALGGFMQDPVGVLNEILVDGTYGKPATGDFGGTFTTRDIEGFPGATGAERTDRGLDAVMYMLAETGGDTQRHADGLPPQIFSDEFEIVDHGDNTYTVVLAGVTDLSLPSSGLNPHTLSPRDTDVYSVPSALDATTGSNDYALLIDEALRRAGVPRGANLMLVGHSFGSDSAFDLASDPEFNGVRYNVTHAIGAAYHNEPQLEYLQPDTEVLVLQNTNDIPVFVESLLDLATFDSPTKGDHSAIVREFDGGWAGLGHHQDNYLEYLGSSVTGGEDPEMAEFFGSLDEAGYTRSGQGLAVDVSVDDPDASPPEGLLAPVGRGLNEAVHWVSEFDPVPDHLLP